MMISKVMTLGALSGVIIGCGMPSYHPFEGSREFNAWLVESAQADQVSSGIINQYTIFPHQFIPDSSQLNELGIHELTVMAQHLNDHLDTLDTVEEKPEIIRVYFDFDESDIRQDNIEVLDAALENLQENRALGVLITGRADVRGAIDYNQALGQRRAVVVRDYFISHGIDPSRLSIVSRGELDAQAVETDIEGMQEDRRTQFALTNLESTPVKKQLNVRRGRVVDQLYDARVKAVISFLDDAGVDSERIGISDGFPGGHGMASERVYNVFIVLKDAD